MRYMATKLDSSKTCPKCQELHPPDQHCKPKFCTKPQGRKENSVTISSDLTLALVNTREELNKYVSKVKQKKAPSKCCGKYHTYDKVPTKQLSAGQKFLNMSVPNCGAYVKKIKACFVCFDPGNRGANCKWKNSQKCNESDRTSECGALHNKILHGCGVEYCQYHTTVTKTSSYGMV